jgi:hypothetical protein
MGLWQFAYKNWTVSREIPRLLLKSGIIRENDIPKYCCKLKEPDYENYFQFGLVTMGAVGLV